MPLSKSGRAQGWLRNTQLRPRAFCQGAPRRPPSAESRGAPSPRGRDLLPWELYWRQSEMPLPRLLHHVRGRGRPRLEEPGPGMSSGPLPSLGMLTVGTRPHLLVEDALGDPNAPRPPTLGTRSHKPIRDTPRMSPALQNQKTTNERVQGEMKKLSRRRVSGCKKLNLVQMLSS